MKDLKSTLGELILCLALLSKRVEKLEGILKAQTEAIESLTNISKLQQKMIELNKASNKLPLLFDRGPKNDSEVN